MALLVLPALPGAAHAQVVGLASTLLSKVEDIGAYALVPVLKSKNTYTGLGIGMEISIQVASKHDTTIAARTYLCDRARRKGRPCDASKTKDTTRAVEYSYRSPRVDTLRDRDGSLHIQKVGPALDSTVTLTISNVGETAWTASLAVGSKSTEISSDSLFQGWRLGGRIQEYPTLALYVANRPERAVSIYGGVTVAPADLKNARLTMGDSTATTEQSTVGLGATLGAVAELFGFLQVFLEGEYTATSFEALSWKRPQNLPAGAAPTVLEMRGLRASLGVQVPLGK